MLAQHAPAPQSPRRLGVGIDTARYGHYAVFLSADLQPAAAELPFAESAAGYQQLRQRLEHIAQRHGRVHFLVRLDAAGQYADNLLHFLHRLGTAGRRRTPAAFALTLSCGDPQRNKNYRAALFGSQEVRSRRGPRRRPLRAHRTADRCHPVVTPGSGPSARLPAASRPSSANAPAWSTSSITCSPSPSPNWPCSPRSSPPAGSSNCVHRYPTAPRLAQQHLKNSPTSLMSPTSTSPPCSTTLAPPSPP